MSSFVHGMRILAGFVIVLAALALYVKFGDVRQLAQERADDLKASEMARFTGSDEITNDIRSDSKELTHVKVANLHDRQKAAGYGRIVGDYGSFVIVANNKGADLSPSGLETQRLETTVNL